MSMFPPRVNAFGLPALGPGPTGAIPEGVPADPDTRTPSSFLWWMFGQQKRLMLVGVVTSLIWFLPSAIAPWLLGRAIDEGIIRRDVTAALAWAGALLLTTTVSVAAGVSMHTAIVANWLAAMYRTTMLVGRKAGQLGHVLPRRTPTGEVMSVAMSDSDTFGATIEIVCRATGAMAAFVVVAGIVLSENLLLGMVVLVAAPVLVGAASPLLRPLQGARTLERTRSSELTGMATDIVAGLRILRGIGGEATFGDNYARQSQRVRQAGVQAGTWQAMVDATGVLLSGILLVLLTYLGTREMLAGRLSIGQLISFFGYAIFLIWPIQTFFELAQKWVQALVAAKKTIAVLGQPTPWLEPESPQQLPVNARIEDAASGFIGEPGRLTIVVSSVPDDSAALADRIGRYLAGHEEPISTEIDEALKGRAAKRARAEKLAELAERERQDAERARQPWGVSIGGVDLAQVPISELRQRVLVSDTSSLVFAGTLQDLIDPHGTSTVEDAEQALVTASAEDVFDALPGGWQGRLDERGRGLSGGQRQRLVLARALVADPEVLVLVEPTSAVDAHTEARIAERLAEHRRGRTTIITTVSPLLLHHADEVVLMVDRRCVERGTHHDLFERSLAYRNVVARDLGEPAAEPAAGAAITHASITGGVSR